MISADQVIALAGLAVLCSIGCGAATVLIPSRSGPAPTTPPAPRPVPPRPATTSARPAPQPVAWSTIPPIVVQGPPTTRGSLPYHGPMVRIPSCSLCKDGAHVTGTTCILCDARPALPEPSDG